MNLSEFFSETAEPADAARLTAIEDAIGRTLPDDYRALIKETGGGTLTSEKCIMPGLPGSAEGLAAEDIFGNGSTSTGRCLDLATYATYLMEEWGIPAEVLLFATTEDGMHNCFVINYDHPDYPTGAVLHLNTDPGGAMTRVADSVTDFLSKLEPYSGEDAEEYHPSAGQEGMGLKGAWYGDLSSTLTRAVNATPTPDMEYLLRKAAASLANPLNLNIFQRPKEGRRFLDVLYWVTQHLNPQVDADTYTNYNHKDEEGNLDALLHDSFLVEGQRYRFVWVAGFVDAWWNDRVARGLLSPTPNGFALDRSYIAQVLEELREEEPVVGS
ncbi:SMI1/KNR4 family protein [Corynebacterium endometrii]|uniref:SMI1 / KNR4 family protein n=1 Tax=Corynebacterium endometrii TaxID=2488819 RepID=A0A4P7QGX9_9CORY|nr:SMI1/KNR4 family protein [Corynebacterium endometrii]QCB28873.1 SMI1 / KNR4 family protein [Corynebacterium endometrii]